MIFDVCRFFGSYALFEIIDQYFVKKKNVLFPTTIFSTNQKIHEFKLYIKLYIELEKE